MSLAICGRCSSELDPDQIEPACERCGLDGCCADCMGDHVCNPVPKAKRGRPAKSGVHKPKDPEACKLARLALIEQRQHAFVASRHPAPAKKGTRT